MIKWPALALLAGCCAPPSHLPAPQTPAAVASKPTTTSVAIVAPPPANAGTIAPESADSRDAKDIALDAQRKPAQLMAFAQIKPGMRVADLAAGTGYTTELLARAVGPSGTVYAQNSPFILQRFAAAPLQARLEKPIMARVTPVESEFDQPLPGIGDLDAALMVLFYHDTVWFGTDRAAMNRAIFDALKPGGSFVVVDHSARPEDGLSKAQSLHRIAENIVVQEVSAAGFVLDEKADFLRESDDPRDWDASPSGAGLRRGQSDRFVLRFVKPSP